MRSAAKIFFLLLVNLNVYGQVNWTTPFNIGSRWGISDPVLEVVNGNPAICHRDAGQDVIFTRALDNCGDTWGAAINVSNLYIPGINTHGFPYLTIVDGHPAICFQDITNSTFIYCRADDIDGTLWSNFQVIDTGGILGFKSVMLVVNGNPAIVYTFQGASCTSQIKYVHANDAQGTSWNSPIILADNLCNFYTESDNQVDLHILNGHPAVSLRLNSNSGPGDPSGAYFARANDPDGSSWPAPILVYDKGWSRGFTVVDNKPHILVGFTNSTTFVDSLGIAVSTDDLGTLWSGTLNKINFDGADIYNGKIHNFENAVWVTGAIDDSSNDSLVYVSAANSSPLNFSSKELISDNVSFNMGSDLNSICGSLASSYITSYCFYTRSDPFSTFYLDADLDGYGDINMSQFAHFSPTGYVSNSADCDDANSNITFPGTPCDDGNSCTNGTILLPDCSCGNPSSVNSTTNTFIGINDLWMDPANWSLNVIPDICHDVVIPANKSVKILSGETGICYTIDVHSSSIFEVSLLGVLEVVTNIN